VGGAWKLGGAGAGSRLLERPPPSVVMGARRGTSAGVRSSPAGSGSAVRVQRILL
jgi:hypothetical protein